MIICNAGEKTVIALKICQYLMDFEGFCGYSNYYNGFYIKCEV